MNKAITATALAAALLTGGTTTATGLYKDVQLNVDGRSERVGAFALTVADLLASRGITINAGDVVRPALNSPVTDGATVEVQYSKPVTLNVDGTPLTIVTTAATLDRVLAATSVPEIEAAWLSVSPSTPLPRAGLTVTVSTPKQVQLKVAGKSAELTTTATTVAGLLAEQGLTLATTDRLRPASSTTVTEGQQIVLDRVVVKSKTKTEPVKFKTVQKNNSSLWKGESRIVASGKVGKARRTYTLTLVNGELTKRVVASETVLTKPVAQVIEVGTKVSANGVGINLARAAMWDRIARCESGGNWSINTGNGYYGGLQFNLASWNSNGGRDFAAYPHHASRAQQITVANRYYAKAGTSPWTCA
ncbi:MAG: transglycosylase family protein [Propionibacteriaceae bacterium]|nr:transglycosylase family protein [Propionibacteriaceae bacterium]